MQVFANNFSTTLAAQITSGATTMQVASASGLPSLLTDWCYLTLIDRDVDGNESDWEIVKATGVASNTITIVRAQEGTTAQTWPLGTPVELRQVAGGIQPRTDALDEIGVALVDADEITGRDDSTGKLVKILMSRFWTYVLDKLGANAATVRSTISAEQANANIAKINVAQTWTAKQTFGETTWGTSTTSRTTLDPVYGDSQYMAVTSNRTFTIALDEGQSVLLTMAISNSPTITFGSVSWFGGAPTLDNGTHRVAFDKINNTIYGTYSGKVE